MNPLTNVKSLNKINERELQFGVAGDDRRSWHAKYRDSAWIFVGGLPYELSEGDTIAVFSQYGEIVNINLIRDKKTGKSRGFGFICYEDQRSTTLAVDNFNGVKLLGRTVRVDHVENYRVPKDRDDIDEETRRLWMEGCGPEVPREQRKDEEEMKKEIPQIPSRNDRDDDTKEESRQHRKKTKHSDDERDKRHRKEEKERDRRHGVRKKREVDDDDRGRHEKKHRHK